MIKSYREYDFSKTPLTVKQAIRINCIICMGYETTEVKNCTSVNCPLYPHRLGKMKRGDTFYKINYLDGSVSQIEKTPFPEHLKVKKQ